MTGEAAIQTDRISKLYGQVEAVRALSISVAAGRVTAFLGLNGAGKSTTIRMLLGMTRPSSGNATVLGQPVGDLAAGVSARKHIAYVSENKRLYDYMTVGEMVAFTRAFYSDWRDEEERRLLRQFELPLDRKVRALSKGMRTKLCLLLAFARRSDLVILDEPSDGLDPVGVEEMLEGAVAQCAHGAAVFFSSHQIVEVERIADRVCMLHRGSLQLDAGMEELRQSYRSIDLGFPRLPAEDEFRMPGVERIVCRGRQMRVIASSNADAVIARAYSFHATSVDIGPVGLREIFLENVRGK